MASKTPLPAAASVTKLAAVSFSETSTRLDKWLWGLRLYKTRALATAACRAGAVQVNQLLAKPAREVRIGEIVDVRQGVMTRTLKVLAIPAARLGAKRVPAHAEELTPPSEFAKAQEQRLQHLLAKERGGGRPTKRDRRLRDRLWA
jgi:ribosome-associated heat shock protein Hsp15